MDFTRFYETQFERLVFLASLYLGTDDAHDVVQDVMLTLWEKNGSLTFVDDMESYAFSSVKHRCLDILKHERYKQEYCRRTLSRLRTELELEMQSDRSTVMLDIEYREAMSRAENAVAALPKRCREVFMLSRVDGMAYRDIAAQMGISQNTVECQMTVALRRLRKAL